MFGKESINRTVKISVADVPKVWAVLDTSWAASAVLTKAFHYLSKMIYFTLETLIDYYIKTHSL